MTTTLSLKNLPEEVIEIIAGHLSLRDVTACSGVNRSLRAALDKDRIWRRFCTFHPNYFHKQESKLKYSKNAFKGCEAKQQLFKELFVQRNLLQNKLHKANVKIKTTNCFGVQDSVDEEGNHWLFIVGGTWMEEYELQMWNLNKNPVLQSKVAFPFGDDLNFSPFCSWEYQEINIKMKTNKLFCSSYGSVFVYDFSPPQFNLNLLFRIVSPHPKYSDFLHMNNLFFCFFREGENDTQFPCVHVWDEAGSEVFKNDSSPKFWGDNGKCVQSVLSRTSDNVLVATHRKLENSRDARMEHVIKLFNVKSFQYSNVCTMTLNYLHFRLLAGDIVGCVTQVDDECATLKCFDRSGTVIHKTTLKERPFGDWSLFSSNGSNKFGIVINELCIVFEVDILLNVVMERFRWKSDGTLDCRTPFILNEALLFLYVYSYINDDHDNEVWDMRTSQKVGKCGFVLEFLKYIDLFRSPSKIIAIQAQEQWIPGPFQIDVISAW